MFGNSVQCFLGGVDVGEFERNESKPWPDKLTQ
jgi:hypothetical protein